MNKSGSGKERMVSFIQSLLFMQNEPTNSDILEAISVFSTNVDEKFDQIDQRFDRLETDVTRIKATMVTKEYLDEKMSDLRGDLVVLVRKEDTKVTALVGELTRLNVLPEDSAKRILNMEPFAR
jgi:hypothetical protein